MPKIYLSPSFQDHNVGVGEFGTEERRCNEIADVVERELKKSDKFVIVRNDPNMSLSEVIADSNKNKPDVHFSIHTNAGASSARGCEVYAYKQGTEGDKLAQIVYRRLSAITPSEDRGVKYNSLAETRQTNSIAVLTEVSFHSNIDDANWMINNIEKIGKELAMSLYEYYGIEQNDKKQEEVKPIESTYTHKEFVTDVQIAEGQTGKWIDGIAGEKTLKLTPTVSISKNRNHKIVTPLEKYLKLLGYYNGEIEAEKGKTPIFGNGMKEAVKNYQRDMGLKIIDGEITARANTWKKLLKLA